MRARCRNGTLLLTVCSFPDLHTKHSLRCLPYRRSRHVILNAANSADCKTSTSPPLPDLVKREIEMWANVTISQLV